MSHANPCFQKTLQSTINKKVRQKPHHNEQPTKSNHPYSDIGIPCLLAPVVNIGSDSVVEFANEREYSLSAVLPSSFDFKVCFHLFHCDSLLSIYDTSITYLRHYVKSYNEKK